jgi:GTP cyclohydrolase II
MGIVQIGPLWRVASAQMPTKWGPTFQVLGFERPILKGTRGPETALALILGDLSKGIPLVRIHSQCVTSEGVWVAALRLQRSARHRHEGYRR